MHKQSRRESDWNISDPDPVSTSLPSPPFVPLGYGREESNLCDAAWLHAHSQRRMGQLVGGKIGYWQAPFGGEGGTTWHCNLGASLIQWSTVCAYVYRHGRVCSRDTGNLEKQASLYSLGSAVRWHYRETGAALATFNTMQKHTNRARYFCAFSNNIIN